MLQFEILLFLGLAVIIPLLARRQVTPALWILFWAHSALTSVRHAPVFVAVAAPLIAAELTLWWNAWTDGAPKGSIRRILSELATDCAPGLQRTSVWVMAAVLAMVLIGEPLRWPKDFPDEKFPNQMVARYSDRIAQARVLTSDQWADYLIYRNYPRQRVFCDGRSDFFGREIGQQYSRIVNGHYEWESLMERHKFDLVLAPIEWPLTALLKKSSSWRLIADDGKALLFERKSAGTAKLDRPKVPVPFSQKMGGPEKNGQPHLMKGTDSAEGITGDQQS